MEQPQTIISTKPQQLLRTELLISYVLRIGVFICSFVIAFGVIITWITPSALNQFSGSVLPSLMSGQSVDAIEIPRSVAQFKLALIALQPNAIIALGLLLLIALPIIRVGLTVFIFLFERDYVYLFITLFVFSVLISGIILGKTI